MFEWPSKCIELFLSFFIWKPFGWSSRQGIVWNREKKSVSWMFQSMFIDVGKYNGKPGNTMVNLFEYRVALLRLYAKYYMSNVYVMTDWKFFDFQSLNLQLFSSFVCIKNNTQNADKLFLSIIIARVKDHWVPCKMSNDTLIRRLNVIFKTLQYLFFFLEYLFSGFFNTNMIITI